MFWRMAGLSTATPVEAILDKDEFTLEELLDEDEIIQECKALNGRLINFLRERAKVKQLVQYIVKEPPEGAEKQRTFKFPFIACEIFTCEVDIILKALIEDEELMDLLFSFLEPERPHGALLAGYFGKVVVCLSLRKTTPLMNYIQVHQDIIRRLVNLIGITSIMEVLIRLIGADEHIYANCSDSMQWIEDMNVLELIVEKFSSSDCPEVHANAAETLCAITRSAPPALASKISSPSFIERLFQHALEDLRPKSELVNLLSVCISLLDPKRYASGTYYMYTRQMTHGSGTAASPETVKGMLDVLGDLLKLLDISSEDHVLLTTYGKLQPPLGKHRLKPTIPVEGRKPPRIGNIGHLTRIANKLVQLGNSNSDIQTFLQENSDWADWETDILLNRNAVENVFQWACGRPTALQDRNRDSDDDDYQDRDYDLAALANNLSQAFRYGIYSNDDIEEAHGSMERDGEDIYFDDESAEVVISSLRLGGDDQESGSLFTNPKWFAFEEERNAHEHSTASSSPNTEGHDGIGGADNVIVEEDEDLADTAASGPSEQKSDDVDDMPRKLSEGLRQNEMCASYKPPEWVEWRESSDALEDPPPLDTANVSDASQLPSLPNGKLPVELDQPDKTAASRVTTDEPADSCKTESEGSPTYPSLSTEVPEGNQSTENILDPHSGIDVFSGILEHEKVN